MDSILASHPAATGSNQSIFSEEILKLLRFIDGTALKIGRGLDSADQTHLVLASGKLVLQKNIENFS